MSDKFEEMRINNCRYHPPAQGCPHSDKEEMEKVIELLWHVKGNNIHYIGMEDIENLRRANELYCKKCEKYKPEQRKER